jgi:hypothetical protein
MNNWLSLAYKEVKGPKKAGGKGTPKEAVLYPFMYGVLFCDNRQWQCA